MSYMVTIGHKDTKTGEMTSELEMPNFGLGVYLMKEPGECKSAVSHAINSGYRLIDTAMAYGNEQEVGQAIRESDVPREEIFVVTKLRRPHATGYEEVLRRCRESMENLGIGPIDLYLVHAPPEDITAREPVWKAMEQCLERGWVRSIGVSNYGNHHLEDMLNYARIMPAVNQIEINPWLQRPSLISATIESGATPMAYSPLARGHKVRDPSLVQIADILGCTPAQVAIKWCIDSGAITIPKSSNPDRIVENFHSQNIDITPVMEQLQSMDENYVSGWDPTVEI
ncbi:MAG: aldo/keto reductase [Candidatus Thermoplasmatota archaeon]|nr:aldo/keto reductase [Candidatus Thermoplasmatota archaeon]MEC9200433.1 aldo/keto reductase [Candidatus Thermoplasmatota archaeon]